MISLKKTIGILLVLTLIFSSFATPAFAAKPAKVASFIIEEVQFYDFDLGGDQDVALFTVKDNEGVPTVIDPDIGSARIDTLQVKNKTKYVLFYNANDEIIISNTINLTLRAYNSTGTLTEKQLIIDIIQSNPTNQAPINTILPAIEGTFEVGSIAHPNLGEWDDEGEIELTANWEINEQIMPVDGDLTLLSEWAGYSISLMVTATDSEGLWNNAASESYLITNPIVYPSEINYVVLGDSIATGTIVPNYIDSEIPYPEYFKSYIESSSGITVNMHDFSVDGDHTADLLFKLKNDLAMRESVQNADIITVSIGGNNLMYAANYSFFGISYYDFDQIDETKADAGRDAFVTEFPQIITTLKSLNSEAQIIVNTIYNPFNNVSDIEHYNLVQSYLYSNGNGINDVIMNESGYDVADIHKAYDEGYANSKEEITYMYIQDTILFFELRNPHPNSLGQSIIEDIHENLYRQIIK